MPLRLTSLLPRILPLSGQGTENPAIDFNSSPSFSLPYFNTTFGESYQPLTVDASNLYRDSSRPKQVIVVVSNWLSLLGALVIVIHVPFVTQRVPAQTKRMFIILFTAISNFGFALANVITDFTAADSYLSCSVSAWCYVFFQLLTCTLVIVSTFRLCGVFLFTEKRSIHSKYIVICPIIAFTLATIPAAAGRFNYNECSHYCWFEPVVQTCRIKSLWAWLCYYGWMILFLVILFGSTLYVMAKIATSVTASRRDLESVANQPIDYVTAEVAPTRPLSRIQNTATAIPKGHEMQRDQDNQGNYESENVAELTSFGIDINILRRNTTNDASECSNNIQLQTQSSDIARPNPTESVGILRAKERPFFVAILRQALYPITISVSGCVQIVADLMVTEEVDYDNALGYVANVATSIQGFLFFLVFMFDPAVVYTRQQWRKYMIWKYYIEFYYSLGMPQEGRDFEDRFMEKCRGLEQYGNETKFDQLTKPPPYSWSLQYDDLAMPVEFRTTYPLEGALANATMNTSAEVISQDQLNTATSNDEHNGTENDTITLNNLSGMTQEGIVSQGSSSTTSCNETSDSLREAAGTVVMTDKNGDIDISSETLTTRTEYTTSFNSPSLDEPPPSPTANTNDPGMPPAVSINIPSQSASIESISAPRPTRGQPQNSSRNAHDPLEYDNDSGIDSDGAVAPRRRVVVGAHQPGDVLSFPRLKRATTIGGTDYNYRRNGITTKHSVKIRSRRSIPVQNFNRISKGATLGQSALVNWGKLLVWPSFQDENLVQKQYQSQFKYPRLAYLAHICVRQAFIPSAARLPQIPSPFQRHQNINSDSINVSQ